MTVDSLVKYKAHETRAILNSIKKSKAFYGKLVVRRSYPVTLKCRRA